MEKRPAWQMPHGRKGSVWLLPPLTLHRPGCLQVSGSGNPTTRLGHTRVMVLFVAATRGVGGAGPLGGGVPPAGPSPVPALRVWWGSEHLWWRVWSVASWRSAGLALPYTHSRLSQGAMDDVDDGLQATALQQCAVVTLNDMHRHLPVTHLKILSCYSVTSTKQPTCKSPASPVPLTWERL